MPEVVEVRLFEDYINRYIKDDIEVLNETVIPTGKYKVKYVSSHGKKLFIKLEQSYLLVFSFSMMGKWIILIKGRAIPEHSAFSFRSGNNDFYFIANPDWKFKAKIEVTNITKKQYIKDNKLGLDAFDIELPEWLERWKKRQSRSKICIAAALLDQSVIAGIGNYIRSEMLYLSRIDPRKSLNMLTDDELTSLYHSMKNVIDSSYESGGLNMLHFDNPLKTGKYDTMVYNKEYDSLGRKVKVLEINRRKIYYIDLQLSNDI